MDPKKLLIRITINPHNVDYDDFVRLIEAFGFRPLRIKGSHHIFGRDDLPDLINLQPRKGEAKPQQIREFLRRIEKYGLKLEDVE
jgi:predicted RNA binding protein YcfA (HicA-like mRNA interferase family)